MNNIEIYYRFFPSVRFYETVDDGAALSALITAYYNGDIFAVPPEKKYYASRPVRCTSPAETSEAWAESF